PGGEAADVRPLGVCTLKLLVGEVPVLVPVLLLGDAEVDEGLVPDVGEAHLASDVTQPVGKSLLRLECRSRPPRRPRASPDSSPSRARAAHAARRGREGGGSTA